MAYNDASYTKVPPFPHQFEELVEPVCIPTSAGMFSAHTAGMTILKTSIAVKEEINTKIAGFPRTHKSVELANGYFRVACGVDTTTCSKGGVFN